MIFQPILFDVAKNATEAGRQVADVINGIVDAGLFIGLVMGIGGMILLFTTGILKINIMGGIFRGEGMRTLLYAMETMIIIPTFIGILWLLNGLADNGAFGSPSEVGTAGWVIKILWKYISARLGEIASWFI